jgi:hypothetical protein
VHHHANSATFAESYNQNPNISKKNGRSLHTREFVVECSSLSVADVAPKRIAGKAMPALIMPKVLSPSLIPPYK